MRTGGPRNRPVMSERKKKGYRNNTLVLPGEQKKKPARFRQQMGGRGTLTRPSVGKSRLLRDAVPPEFEVDYRFPEWKKEGGQRGVVEDFVHLGRGEKEGGI